MAFLLLPGIAQATGQTAAGLAVAIDNARKAEQTSISFSIGNKVFTTAKTKPFPFHELPYELREEIIILALERSKTLLQAFEISPTILPVPGVWPARDHPFRDPEHPLYHHPMNPYHDRNLPRPREVNGYPLSSWRWQLICREWRAIIRPRLWHTVTLVERPAYDGFLKLLKDPDIPGYVRDIEMKEGFDMDMFKVYTIMTSLPHAERIAYSPRPVAAYRQPFGINLVPSNPGPTSLTIGVPFDEVTNDTTRKHLHNLTRLTNLNIHVLHLTPAMAVFLRSLTQVRSLTLTVYAFSFHALEAFTFANMPPSSHTISSNGDGEGQEHGQGLKELVIFALRIMEGQADAIREFIARDPHLSRMCTMYAGRAKDAKLIYSPEIARAEEAAVAGPSEKEQGEGAKATKDGESKNDQEHWERTTKVKFLGGLVELTMESRK